MSITTSTRQHETLHSTEADLSIAEVLITVLTRWVATRVHLWPQLRSQEPKAQGRTLLMGSRGKEQARPWPWAPDLAIEGLNGLQGPLRRVQNHEAASVVGQRPKQQGQIGMSKQSQKSLRRHKFLAVCQIHIPGLQMWKIGQFTVPSFGNSRIRGADSDSFDRAGIERSPPATRVHGTLARSLNGRPSSCLTGRAFP